jgi:pentatricopeptide repeat protein
LKDALKLLEEMKKEAPMQGENSSGHVMAYTAAITGCAQGGKWRKAFQLLSAMIQDSYLPNSLTYSAVISSCAEAISLSASSSDKEEDWLLPMEASLGLFDEIKQKQPHLLNIQIYNAAIRVYAEAHNPEKALQLFHEAAAASIEPDIFTFGCLMTACERAGKMDQVVQVLQHMKVYNMTPNEIIYGAAISCCRKNSEVGALSSF